MRLSCWQNQDWKRSLKGIIFLCVFLSYLVKLDRMPPVVSVPWFRKHYANDLSPTCLITLWERKQWFQGQSCRSWLHAVTCHRGEGHRLWAQPARLCPVRLCDCVAAVWVLQLFEPPFLHLWDGDEGCNVCFMRSLWGLPPLKYLRTVPGT